jgi:hypothetical protein
MATFGQTLRHLGELGSGALSSVFFGNTIGVANNLMGRRLLRRCRRAFRPREGVPAPARGAADELRRTGILELPRFYPAELIRDITARLDRMLGDPRTSKPRDTAIIHGVPEATRNLRDPLKTLPELAQLVSPELVGLLETHYQSHARVVVVQVYRNAHVDLSAVKAREIFSSQWHFDRQHSAYVQLMVLLSDGVTRATGAFETHDIDTTKKLVRSGYVTRNRIYGSAARMINDPARIRYFEGGAGDAMLTNSTLCLHRAGIPKPGSIRDVMLVHFEPAETPMNAGWPEELEPLPGDDGFLVRRDRPVYNAGAGRFHPAVVAYYRKLERELGERPGARE